MYSVHVTCTLYEPPGSAVLMLTALRPAVAAEPAMNIALGEVVARLVFGWLVAVSQPNVVASATHLPLVRIEAAKSSAKSKPGCAETVVRSSTKRVVVMGGTPTG